MTELVTKRRGGDPKLIGYARVSRREQNLDSQIDALSKANVCCIYQEKVSGAATVRPAFRAMMDVLRPGDVVVVHALDRLGRKLSELVRTLDTLQEIGAHFRDLRHGLDTSTRHGDMLLKLLMVLAESERELTRERTRDGVAAAAKRGRFPGRPSKLTPGRIDHIVREHRKGHSIYQIAKEEKLAEATIRKALELRDTANGDLKRQPRLRGL